MRLQRGVFLGVSLLIATGLVQSQPAWAGSVGLMAKARKHSSNVMVDFEGFAVDLTLSSRAKQELNDRKETIIVAAYFTGRPRPDTDKKLVSDMGEIGLGDAKVEVAPGQSAQFERVSLDRKALDQSLDKNPILLINVYSGRKSSKDNLLDCGIYEDDLKPIQGKSIPIACKLIGEQ